MIVHIVLSNIFLIDKSFWFDHMLMKIDSFTYNFTHLILVKTKYAPICSEVSMLPKDWEQGGAGAGGIQVFFGD